MGAFYVSTTGNDANDGSLASPWRTVGKAASSVPAGSTVFIRGGTYTPFTVTRSGLSGTPTRYVRYPGETVVIAGDGVRSTVVLVSGAHDVVIQGLVIQNAPNQWGAGVRIDNGAYRVSILANTIRNNRSFGVKLAGVTGISVKGNDIAKNETGIEISGSGAGIVIDGNEIHDNDRMVVNTIGGNDDRGANGIVFYRTTGSILVTGNLIYNNRATSYDYGYDGGAFEIYAASNVEIRGNSVWNNENVMETGTDGTDCSDNRFVGNVAYGGAKTGPTMGMILRCARNMLVAHNSFYGLDRFVFDVNAQASAFGGSIDGLRILNNASVMTGAKIYSIDSAMPASVVINHGVTRETTGGSIAYVYGKGNTSSLATFTSWTGFEAAGLQVDPQFVGPDAGNFTLAATSPAIDRGLVLIGVNDGYVGTAPDQGAREYRP